MSDDVDAPGSDGEETFNARGVAPADGGDRGSAANREA